MPLPTGLSRDEKSGLFHLRIGVPDDVRPYWPPKPSGKPATDAYRRSLQTRDRHEALTRAHALIADYNQRFASLRARNQPQFTPLTPTLIVHLHSRLKHELLRLDDIRRVVGNVLDSVPLDMVGDLPEELTETERLQMWANVARTLQARGEYGLTIYVMNSMLRLMGLPIASWTQHPAALALSGRVVAQVFTDIANRSAGEIVETPGAPQPYVAATAEPEAPTAPAVTLRSVVPDWKSLNDSNEEAVSRMYKALDLWEAAVGVLPIDQITKATGGKFVLFLLDEKARKFKDKTAKNHASNINAVMNVAAKLGIVPANPLDLSFPVNDSEKRTPWTTEELALLHGTPVTGEQPEGVDPADAEVLKSMLLWSGARIGEVAGLRVQDIQERDGILAAFIRLETTKKAKHGAKDVSVRWVPIASAIRAMVLEHRDRRRDEGIEALFPSFNRKIKLTPSDQAGRWFLAHRERLGLSTGRLDGSHKWRHTVRSKLVAEGLGEALMDAITGHQAAGGSAGRKNYTHLDRLPLAKVLEAIERLAWPWPTPPLQSN